MVETTGIDKLGQMRETVINELKHIPAGNLAQNKLRQIYWMLRMNSLGKKSKGIQSKEDVLRTSIESIKESFAAFEPNYDRQFFKC